MARPRDQDEQRPAREAPAALNAPWRSGYIDDLGSAERRSGPPSVSSGCFIRDYWLSPQDDAKNHVIVRTVDGLIMLNKFPYAGGHLLVALGEGRPRLMDYPAAQRAKLWEMTDLAADLMERTLEPQGINIGLNQGRAAGAGVPQHVHVHLVPRWGGDVNFMAVVAGVRVISFSLEKMADRYRAVWGAMARG